MNEVVRAVFRLVIDYFRWTQLVPMLAAWGVLIAVVLAIAVTSFEEQGIAVLEIVFGIVAAIVQLLPESLVSRAENGAVDLSGDDLIALAGWAWLILSVMAMLVNWLVGERLRPAFLTTLSGRIRTAGVLAAASSAALIAIRIVEPQNFNGPLLSWLPTFVGGPLIVWIISVYSLSVSAVLGIVEAGLEAMPARDRL